MSPIGKRLGTATDFFSAYLAVFVVAAFWIAGYFWKREGWLRTAQMDVDTGRRELDWDLINRERAEIATYDDHRMAMSFALAGTKVHGVVIKDAECVNKTYPQFFEDLKRVTSSI